MKKIKNVVILVLLLIDLNILMACTGFATSANNDTLKTPAPDSMPVIKPRITDSESILITPPVNDKNNIVPDTLNK